MGRVIDIKSGVGERVKLNLREVYLPDGIDYVPETEHTKSKIAAVYTSDGQLREWLNSNSASHGLYWNTYRQLHGKSFAWRWFEFKFKLVRRVPKFKDLIVWHVWECR